MDDFKNEMIPNKVIERYHENLWEMYSSLVLNDFHTLIKHTLIVL